ncbi:hypothetical protein [Candidatus Methylomicrobium oryzae]|uniref:hypothetical protein n=1 Tax=Candidatus Methylomicrobium oryzae TaxID=2802053 RepID=UPI001921F9AA|nr:hypothetical protein [Methylomicrobium sp. RS1]MBL1264141.1 hypothetical protein [Methylomicrobium sp. RS1]
MNKLDSIKEIKSIILDNMDIDFTSLMHKSSNFESIIYGLIYALGYEFVSVNHSSDIITFEASIGVSTELVILFDSKNKTISGPLKEQIVQVFELVKAIETELTDAMMYPPHLRQQAVESVCNRIGVSRERFSTVLKNWSAY